MSYVENLCKAMANLATFPNTIFMGQAVACPGTAMSRTFRDVPKDRLLEMPVAEDMQMGMAIGMSLNGYLPICCYPRFNFLLLAMSQLALHLDKMPLYSTYEPKVIVRVSVGGNSPMYPGVQHLGNYYSALSEILDCVVLDELRSPLDIFPVFNAAIERDGSTLIVEYASLYEE